MKTLNQIFLCEYGWLVKYVIVLPKDLFQINVDKTHELRKFGVEYIINT